MKNYCVIADSNYMLFALTLYESLLALEEEFTLFFLCLDDEVYKFLSEKKLAHVVTLSIYDLENRDTKLHILRFGKASPDAITHGQNKNINPSYIQFCWALASYFSWYLLINTDIGHIVYIDSDLFFYSSTQPIFDEIGNKSVGIIRHRIPYNAHAGEYNVGIVYFKNDKIGVSCVEWWKEALLNPNNKYAATHGTCGDQKYLELFSSLFGEENICVVDNIGHLAPWNVSYHEYKDQKIIWQGLEQELLFFHFAHFVPDFVMESFKTSYVSEWGSQNPALINETTNKLYNDYYEAMKNTKEKYPI